MEKDTDIIIIENGEMFEGTRDQFRDCFFDNANNNEIADWCFVNRWKLVINGEDFL